MSLLPKITIITPSFNQGDYLEETILSVLGQRYPNLEYIIIDGGSADNSKSIIEKYDKELTYWVSEPDNGQSHAINKGLERANGEIIAWLNSDDLYMPGALFRMAQFYKSFGNAIYFGNALHFERKQERVDAVGSDVKLMSKRYDLARVDYIIQPSSFWSFAVWKQCGLLREDMHYAFDWEWFIRGYKLGIPMIPIEDCLSIYRIHPIHKSRLGGMKRRDEIYQLYLQNDKHLAPLYLKLSYERLKPKIRILIKVRSILSILGWQISFGKVLKTIKYFKYRKYQSDEIDQCHLML